MITVVHKSLPHTHYIGRGSVFGNPFTHLPLSQTKALVQTATVKEAVDCFLAWGRRDPKWEHVDPARREHMLKAIWELPKDAVLGCYCHQPPCHGYAIIELKKELR